MRNPETALLLCRISQGGFSGERVIRVQQLDGSEYATAVPTGYCRTMGGDRLDPDVPSFDQEIEGKVEVLLLSNGGNAAKVELPDGSVVTAIASKVLKLHLKEEYVPIGS